MVGVDGVAAQARRGVLRSLSPSVLTSHKETAVKVLRTARSALQRPDTRFGGVKRAGRPFIHSFIWCIQLLGTDDRAIVQCLLGIIARRLHPEQFSRKQWRTDRGESSSSSSSSRPPMIHDGDGGGIPAARLLTAAPLGCAAGARLRWALAVCSLFCGRG